MSLDKSLKSHDKLARGRNVLSREERLQRLLDDEHWKEGDSLFGLPKLKPLRMVAPKKTKKTKEKVDEAAAVTEEPEKGEETAAQ